MDDVLTPSFQTLQQVKFEESGHCLMLNCATVNGGVFCCCFFIDYGIGLHLMFCKFKLLFVTVILPQCKMKKITLPMMKWLCFVFHFVGLLHDLKKKKNHVKKNLYCFSQYVQEHLHRYSIR